MVLGQGDRVLVVYDAQRGQHVVFPHADVLARVGLVPDVIGRPVACGVVTPTARAFLGADVLQLPVALDTGGVLVGDLYLYRRAGDALDGVWAYDRETDTAGRAYAGPNSAQPPYTSPNFDKQYLAYDRFSKFIFLGNVIYDPLGGQAGSPNFPHDGDWVVRRLGNDIYAIDTDTLSYDAGAYANSFGVIPRIPIYQLTGWQASSVWEGVFAWEHAPCDALQTKLADLYADWNWEEDPQPFQFHLVDIGAGALGHPVVSGEIPRQLGWDPDGYQFWLDIVSDVYYYYENFIIQNMNGYVSAFNQPAYIRLSSQNTEHDHACHGLITFALALKSGGGQIEHVFTDQIGVDTSPASLIPQAETVPSMASDGYAEAAGGVVYGPRFVGIAFARQSYDRSNTQLDFVRYSAMVHPPSSRVWRSSDSAAVIFRDRAGAYYTSDLHGVYLPEIDVTLDGFGNPMVAPDAYTWRLGFGKPGIVTNFHGTHASLAALASAWPTPEGDVDAAVADVAGTVAHWIDGAWTLTTIDTPPDFSSNLYMEEGDGKSTPFIPGPPPFVPCPLCVGAVISITLDWPSTYTGSVQWLPSDPCDTTDTTRAAWTRGQKKYMCMADADAFCDATSYYREITWGTGDTIYIYSETGTVHAVDMQGTIFDGFDQYLDNAPTGQISYPLTFTTPISGALGGEEFTVTIDLERGDITSC